MLVHAGPRTHVTALLCISHGTLNHHLSSCSIPHTDQPGANNTLASFLSDEMFAWIRSSDLVVADHPTSRVQSPDQVEHTFPPRSIASPFLQPIESTSPTSQNATLSALVDEQGEGVVALLAFMDASPALPLPVITHMVLNQVPPLPLHQIPPLRRRQVGGIRVAIHNGLSAVDKPPLIPLGTQARLPSSTTGIAELVTTSTSWKEGGNVRMSSLGCLG